MTARGTGPSRKVTTLDGSCPNDCHGEVIPCWNPGGPCPAPTPCDLCGVCRACEETPDA